MTTLLLGLSTLLQISAVATNAPILLVIKGLLRSASTRFLFSLCSSHLLLNLLLLASNWFPPSILPAVLLLSFVVQLSTLATLTLISMDRYLSIARPMEPLLSPRRANIGIGLCWSGAGVIILIPGLFLWPGGWWGWNVYFGLILGGGAVGAVMSMTLTYKNIFAIAREKCHKVRLGEFRREVSISSEWGTSVGIVGFPPRPGSHRLLQQESASPPTSIRSAPNLPTTPLARAKRRWHYLRHNYNSPRKTIATILSLIGSVVVCSLPPAMALLVMPSLFPTLHSILLPLSSNLHPLLYGLLNRAIRQNLIHGKRANLPKSLRRRRKANKKRKVSTLGELRSVFVPPSSRQRVRPPILVESRRGSITTSDDEVTLPLTRPRLDTGQVRGSFSKWKKPVLVLVEGEDDGEEIDQQQPARKSSADSGADMYFSEGDEEEEVVVVSYLSTSKSEGDLCRCHGNVMSRILPRKLSVSADGDLNNFSARG